MEPHRKGEEPISIKFAPFIVPLLLFTGIFLINLHMLCPDVPAGDSGELIEAAYSCGIAHPPGYPLFTMLGRLFCFIPINNIAWRVNLMSCLLNSGTVALIYLIIFNILRSQIPAVTGALFMAFSAVFWKYSHVAEVFPLNNFLISLEIYVVVLWHNRCIIEKNTLKNKTIEKDKNFIYVISFLFGLSLTNHHTAILILPSIILILIVKKLRVFKPSIFIGGLAFFLLGLSPYIYLPIAASYHPYSNWDSPDNLQGFIRIIIRADYGSFVLSPTGMSECSPFLQIPEFFKSIIQEFTFAGFLLALLGMWRLFKKDRILLSFFFISFILCGVVFLMIGNMNINKPSYYAVTSRFHMMPGIFFSLFIGFGIESVISFLIKKKAGNINLLYYTLIIAITLFPAIKNFNSSNQRHNLLPRDFGLNGLRSLPQGAVLIATGDTFLGTIDYFRSCYKMRPDICIIEEKLRYPWYVKQIKARFKEMLFPFDYVDMKKHCIRDFIDANIGRFPIFLHDCTDYTIEQKYSLVPYGLVRQVCLPGQLPSMAEYKKNLEYVENQLKIDKSGLRKISRFNFEEELSYGYSAMYCYKGLFLYKQNDFKGAKDAYIEAIVINSKCTVAYKILGIIYAYDISEPDSAKKAVYYWKEFLKLAPDFSERSKMEAEIKRLEQI